MSPSGTRSFFRYKSCWTNAQQVLQRHRLYRRTSTQNVFTCHRMFVGPPCLNIAAFVLELLAVSGYHSIYSCLSLPHTVLLKYITRAQETGVNLPQSCFLALLGDHGRFEHDSNPEKGKRFYRAVLPVSILQLLLHFMLFGNVT